MDIGRNLRSRRGQAIVAAGGVCAQGGAGVLNVLPQVGAQASEGHNEGVRIDEDEVRKDMEAIF